MWGPWGSIMTLLHRFIADENGATAIEYSLIVILISTVVIAGYVNYASATTNLYDAIAATIAAATTP